MESQTIPRRRGRPPVFDRGAALAAAMKVFWRYGFDGASIALLTEAMGVTPPSLYAAFGSKEALYRAAIEHYLENEGAERTRILHEAPSAYEAVEGYLRDAAARYVAPGKPRGCMVATASLVCGADGAGARKAVASARTRAFRELVAQIERGRARGELPAEIEPRDLAQFYSAVVQGMSAQATDGATRAMLDRIADLALGAWPARPTRAKVRKA